MVEVKSNAINNNIAQEPGMTLEEKSWHMTLKEKLNKFRVEVNVKSDAVKNNIAQESRILGP